MDTTDIKPNQTGTSFSMDLSPHDRWLMMDALSHNGFWNQLGSEPNGDQLDFSLNVVAAVMEGTEWSRPILESIGQTLSTIRKERMTEEARALSAPKRVELFKTITSQLALGMLIRNTLDQNPSDQYPAISPPSTNGAQPPQLEQQSAL